ncbi:MAG: putative Na+/H+ antiporter [Pseudobdellovibrionaceae bacterium]
MIINSPTFFEVLATVCFSFAVLHTFLVKKFQHQAEKYPEGSIPENLFHLLGEVEVVFGLWAGGFLCVAALSEGSHFVKNYLDTRNFTEPLFVFVIMACCSAKPILDIAENLIVKCGQILPLPSTMAFYFSALTLGPLLGSLITEPAAMTITALLLLKRFYHYTISERLKYATLGLLFVNISIGGVLTSYAAPPVLMVASLWNWDTMHMLLNFGWKAVIAILLSNLGTLFIFRKEFAQLQAESANGNFNIATDPSTKNTPLWVNMIHLFFLGLIVLASHHIIIFIGLFLFFLGLVNVTQEYQQELKLKESLLVGFFLGGLVILGGPQKWWLQPVLSALDTLPLYFGAIGLTAITDNAALTYLGSQVDGLSDLTKYALVAGAVVGGGLTVIANAPNPAGYGILNASFGSEGISPMKLFLAALGPTLLAALMFWPWG